MYNKKNGFTLIEILISITIVGILAALVITNLVGGRERAYDSTKKRNLHELQLALNLYLIDFGGYPNAAGNNGFNFYACGETGTSQCSSSFTANNKEYMSRLPKTTTGQNDFRYYPCSGTDYRLKINLSNSSDPDILESQSRCPDDTCSGKTPATLNYGTKDYVVCGSQ